MGQREEIETIRERILKLNLSDADVKRICETAGRVGLSVAELLQNLIGDLVDGTYSNGSDERMYAEQWFDRGWFSYSTDNAFLRYLIDLDIVEDFISSWEDMKSFEQTEEHDEDCIEACIFNYEDAKDYVDHYFSDFLNEVKGQEKPKLEDEMEKVLKYWNEYQQLKNVESK